MRLFEAIVDCKAMQMKMHLLLAQSYHPSLLPGMPGAFITLFVVMFILIVGVIVFQAIRGVMQWADNNQQPIDTVQAKVVTKRTAVSSSGGVNQNGFTSTRYFATFEFASGTRQEYLISAHAYAFLAEGDTGQLTHQGTRYKGFQRLDGASHKEPNVTLTETAAAQTSSEKAFCPFCGAPIGSEFKFCPKCGKTVPEYTSAR